MLSGGWEKTQRDKFLKVITYLKNHVHLVWIPKYRKRVLTGQVAIRARDVLRQIVLEHEIDIITGCQLWKCH